MVPRYQAGTRVLSAAALSIACIFKLILTYSQYVRKLLIANVERVVLKTFWLLNSKCQIMKGIYDVWVDTAARTLEYETRTVLQHMFAAFICILTFFFFKIG